MAGNINTAPRVLWRNVTRFKALKVEQLRTKADPVDFGTYPGLVNLTLKCAPGQTADALQVLDSNDNVMFNVPASNSAAGLANLRVAHAIYNFAVDGGASCTPAGNGTIPANAIIIGATVNPTTAVTAAGAATVGIGTTAGSTTTSLLAATAKASLTIDALVNGVPTLAAPVKMSAAGSISVLIATGPLTAGVIEVFVYYVVAFNA